MHHVRYLVDRASLMSQLSTGGTETFSVVIISPPKYQNYTTGAVPVVLFLCGYCSLTISSFPDLVSPV
jgi:hypothetical protein